MGKQISEQLEAKHMKKAEASYLKITKEYNKAERDIIKEAKAFIGEFSLGNGGTDLAKIMSPMPKMHFKEYEQQITELLERVRGLNNPTLNNIIKSILLKSNLSYVDGFVNIIDLNIGIANAKADSLISDHVNIVYVESFHEAGVDLGYSFKEPNKRAIQIATHGKWLDDVNFSQRLWGKNQTPLVNSVRDDILYSVLRGEDVRKASRRLRDQMGTSYSNAERIIRTETNRVHNRATIDSYIEAGIKEYQILAALDSRTSKECRAQNKKIYKVEDYNEGVTAPPFHPHCRTTITYVRPN